ncbi:MAG TPA: galactokinase [Acidimicrobiia bacterium]
MTSIARAPGRVNLIGGHVDYHDGPVVATAMELGVECRFDTRDDARIVVRSDSFAGTVDIAADGRDAPGSVEPRWGRLVAAVTAELAHLGRAPVGIEAIVTSSLPAGCGLSSSAAFEVAIALALVTAAGMQVEALALARACQTAELAATGVPCGIQDQVASIAGTRGHAVLLDCRDLSIASLPMPADAAVVVVDSGVTRTLEGSPWVARRAESFADAERLGLRVLRDAAVGQVADRPRARHVVEEMQRVWHFADALGAGDIRGAGALMLASHASSRDLFESSVPELDRLVELFVEAGAFGARLTGGGFGGCVVALAPAASAAEIAATVVARYEQATGRTSQAFVSEPADGASVTMLT